MQTEKGFTLYVLEDIVFGILDGENIIDLAARLACDRGVASNYLKRRDFLDMLARALLPLYEIGVTRYKRLTCADPLPGERANACRLRMDFADAVRRVRWRWFDRDPATLDCIAADIFNRETHMTVAGRCWRDGTADELRHGLDTPEKRRAYRCKHGMTFDCAGFGECYAPRRSAAMCQMCYGVRERPKFDMDALNELLVNWRMPTDYDPDRRNAYLRDPLAVRRDPRLPVTRREAEGLWYAVTHGADFLKAAIRL